MERVNIVYVDWVTPAEPLDGLRILLLVKSRERVEGSGAGLEWEGKEKDDQGEP